MLSSPALAWGNVRGLLLSGGRADVDEPSAREVAPPLTYSLGRWSCSLAVLCRAFTLSFSRLLSKFAHGRSLSRRCASSRSAFFFTSSTGGCGGGGDAGLLVNDEGMGFRSPEGTERVLDPARGLNWDACASSSGVMDGVQTWGGGREGGEPAVSDSISIFVSLAEPMDRLA